MKTKFLFLLSLIQCISFAQTKVSSSFIYQDSVRTYTVYIPQAYLDNPQQEVPLLLNLHGYGSINWQQEVYGDFRPIADVDNFIICHPNGTIDPTGSRFWNVGFFNSSIDDVGFLSALIDTLNKNYNIDEAKTFSTGMSNGGFMSHKLACELPNKIKAIASVTGSMTIGQFSNCPNTNSIPVMQIHGTEDPRVPYNGNATMVAVEQVVGLWVNKNGCDSVATITQIEDTNTSDSATATRYDFNSNCNDASSVVFYKIENGGHTWPGAFALPGSVTCLDFDASQVIWKFFCPESKYTGISNTNQNELIKIYPNPSENALNIQLQEDEKLIDISIYNLNGQLMLQGKELIYNISNLDLGAYFVYIKTTKRNYAKKFLKQ